MSSNSQTTFEHDLRKLLATAKSSLWFTSDLQLIEFIEMCLRAYEGAMRLGSLDTITLTFDPNYTKDARRFVSDFLDEK